MEVLKNKSGIKKIRVAIYPRVSTEEQQKTGQSFEAQENKFLEICKSNNREIVKVYKGEGDVKDDRSASIKDDSIKITIEGDKLIVAFDLRKRPNFKQMLMDAKQGLFDELMFYKWDRFSRNIAFQKMAIIYLKRCGIQLYPTDDPKEEIAVDFISVMNEQEPKRTAKRINFTLQDKFNKGKMVASKMPFGYVFDKEKKNGIVSQDEAKTIKQIFEAVAAGTHYKEVCSKFDMKPSTLYSMIKNRVYIGMVEYLGQEKNGIHKAIIDTKLFEKANLQIKSI